MNGFIVLSVVLISALLVLSGLEQASFRKALRIN